MQTNHLAHFLLTAGLLPALRRAAAQPAPPGVAAAAAAAGVDAWRPRVVNVASAMHHFGYAWGPDDPQARARYSAARAYGNSKLAQLLAAAELAARTQRCGVEVVSLHPGNVLTDVVRSLPPLVQRAYRALLGTLLFTPQQGARVRARGAVQQRAAPGHGSAVVLTRPPPPRPRCRRRRRRARVGVCGHRPRRARARRRDRRLPGCKRAAHGAQPRGARRGARGVVLGVVQGAGAAARGLGAAAALTVGGRRGSAG